MTASIARFVWLFAFAFFSSILTQAQQFNHPVSLRWDDSFLSTEKKKQSFPDTIYVLGIMVQFQEDTDSRTTGNGKFELFVGKQDSVIDAPPHDRTYFLNHLKFLENYFRRVSDGKVIIKSDVVNNIYTLPHQMQFYSPPEGNDLKPLGTLVQDAWRTADSLNPEVDFSRYQSFIIFHAGVGRDVNLQDLLGVDPTPFDLPSIFLNFPALKSFFGGSYQGVPVNGGKFFITNSMILPESENRLLPSVVGTSLLELSVNGLLAASFGSFLGLPDLFDTKTGRTGIGRFGLMDGQAIFSFNGLFPPEPSAWEKIFLGWVEPNVAPSGRSNFTLPAVGFHDGRETVIIKVPISAKEYFLVENRNRDSQRDGQRMKTIIGGQLVEKIFQHDTVGFNFLDTKAIRGVVVDVDDYDWSLPGGVSPQGIFFDGGILIWHIDENIIEANLATNTVNADPNRRGVNLMEADGSQDIGQVYDFTQPGSGSENGTALDFWFQDNPAPVYRNAFTPTSHPNSLSNTLANSHIYITDFSQRSPIMTAKVQIGDHLVKPLSGFPKFVSASGFNEAPIAQTAGCPRICNNFFINAKNKLYGFRLDGSSLTKDQTGLFDTNGGKFQPALVYFCTPFIQVVGVSDSTVSVWNAADADSNGRGDLIFSKSVSHRITTPPTVFMQGVNFMIMIGDEDGGVSTVTSDSVKRVIVSPQHAVVAILNVQNQWIAISENKAMALDGTTWEFGGRKALRAASGDLDGDGIPEVVVVTEGNDVLIFNKTSAQVRSFHVQAASQILSAPAIGDLDSDGRKEIVFTVANKIFAYNNAGALIENFPIDIPSDGSTTSSVTLAKLGDVNTLSIFVGTSSGLVVAYDAFGKMIPGFPLATGKAIRSSLALFQEPNELGILAASEDGFLYGWTLPLVSKAIIWGSYLHDPLHSGFESSPSTGQPKVTEFFPKDRAYNWPNPVYDKTTRIRYYLNQNANVSIKIFDLAGEKVDEFSGPGIGSIDNEVEWNVSNIQSGVYFAHVEANGSGQRGVAIIKIAIVK